MPAEFSTGLAEDNTRREDPDLGNLEDYADTEPSDLDSLRAELSAEVTPTTVIEVTGRPGYSVRYRTDFTGRDLDLLRRKAKNKRFVDGIDGVKFAALLLGFTCQAIIRHDKPLEVDGVSPVTFATRELQDLMETRDVDSTVRKFYGLEGHVSAAAARLMSEAGWDDEAYVADPTE